MKETDWDQFVSRKPSRYKKTTNIRASIRNPAESMQKIIEHEGDSEDGSQGAIEIEEAKRRKVFV